MEKIESKSFKETYYKEVLPNGLTVYLWRKPGFHISRFFFGTPYGSLDNIQVDEAGKLIKFPNGIAHFLEHKMFEDEDLNIMTKYTELGSDVNAYTSYEETVYYFSTPNKDIRQELNLLLDFVQKLVIDEEAVEKEKGIIDQELDMYQEQPDTRLVLETNKSLFKAYPYRNDIGGTATDVASINAEMLKECHALNYHPSRMILVGISDQDPEELLKIIKDNQASKHFQKRPELKRFKYEEPIEVARKRVVIPMEVNLPKVSVGYKILEVGLNDRELAKKELAWRIILAAHFTSLNPEYQHWIDKGIINGYFNFDLDLDNGYGSLIFVGEGQPEPFLTFIQTEVNKLRLEPLSAELIEQLKNRNYGIAVSQFDNPDDLGSFFVRLCFNGLEIFDYLSLFSEIDQNYLQEVLNTTVLPQPSLKIIQKQDDSGTKLGQ